MTAQMKIGMAAAAAAAASARLTGSHVVSDVIKDARARLRPRAPPEVVGAGGHVGDVMRPVAVDALECDKANARVRRLQRRRLHRFDRHQG